MKKIKTIKIPSLKGEKLISESKLFDWIDNDFVNWRANEKGNETKATSFDILEITESGTFKDFFTEQMCLTQEQILYFIENYKEDLNDFYTFFLFKSEGKYFVADVSFRSGDRLLVGVYRLEDSREWSAGGPRRVVTPQLETLSADFVPLNLRLLDIEKKMENVLKVINI